MSGKVFIQRDYSGGTRCQFQSKFPPELENRVRWGRARSEPSGTPVPAARLALPCLAAAAGARSSPCARRERRLRARSAAGRWEGLDPVYARRAAGCKGGRARTGWRPAGVQE